jgi:hypothetical protein
VNEMESLISLACVGLVAMFTAFKIERSNPKDVARYTALSLGVGFTFYCVLIFAYPPLFALIGVHDREHAIGPVCVFLFTALLAFTVYLFRRSAKEKPNQPPEPTR